MVTDPDYPVLDAVRIVLVGTTHPGNIGASARAMKTMGLGRLVLVAPSVYPSAEATARASGADDVLYRAEMVATLDQALADCTLVVGASARKRGLSSPELGPREAASRLLAGACRAPVALVFGRESSGLSNTELDRCHYTVRIPANPAYASLNLAASVQVLAYELRQALTETGPDPDDGHLPAPAAELERFYVHLQQVLLAIGFLDPANPRHLMRRLRRLFNRARPDQNEVNILRGILTAVQSSRHGN